MTLFHDLTVPLWEILGGNLVMFASIVFYIAWWTVSFRPNVNSKSASAISFMAVAIIAGVAAITTISVGINSLSQVAKVFPVRYILIGAAASYVILLAVTRIVFQRAVTSELLLMIVWAAIESSVIAVLQSSGRFSTAQALTFGTIIFMTTVIGMICYVLYYRLDGLRRFWDGLIPLVTDAVAVAVLIAAMALSRA
jgi:hypothetical protein